MVGTMRPVPVVAPNEVDAALLPLAPDCLSASDTGAFDAESAALALGEQASTDELPLAGMIRANRKDLISSLRTFLDASGTRMPQQQSLAAGYSLLERPDIAMSPLDNTEYALASQDLNPIHRNRGFAVLAQLPGPITHGMWTYGNCLRVVENQVLKGESSLLRSFEAEFVGMVLPGERVITQVTHVAMQDGSKVMRVDAYATSVS